ncbi:carbonic anhydrase [Marchantia polymorpha subsp. ruderalis]|uniref:Carbonic anhydrase n=2 Tax=Marchantia polymorpha TaxID=3197 RepID=A0A176WM23_MARPO|nr:hypothetical protein AXG93_2891s1230 [Marchantia polymorpha subsp. ruderalis]PTQ39128.1 hypothetical protein MARPO_0047s0102 [Marchantia polymorpha]BBN14784.1 hypothetical protein Mp_6g14480 [Marchantia polymorpha subsp. ruderalis]|eukprot:PTQ39128.1 hypothetical protein MARPO_0047s0102 [Marchantia polymorpha]
MANLRLSKSTALRVTTFYLLAWVVFGADSDFSYYGRSDASGPRPDMWGERPEWRTCKDGKEQSPINIVTANSTFVSDFYRLDTSYSPANGTFFIDSADILEVELQGGGKFTIGDTEYFLQQFHYHSPSEHTIDGVRFPLEMHLVHKSNSGDLAVIGVCFSLGEENQWLAPFWKKLPLLTSKDVVVNFTNIDVGDSKLHLGPAYARYGGSLTTPPCSEKVTWTVILGEVNTISERQMWAYSKMLPHSNARPVQKLHGRKVKNGVGIFKRR